jgi:hypothetical protein
VEIVATLYCLGNNDKEIKLVHVQYKRNFLKIFLIQSVESTGSEPRDTENPLQYPGNQQAAIFTCHLSIYFPHGSYLIYASLALW